LGLRVKEKGITQYGCAVDEGFVLRDSPNKSLLWKYPDWCFNNS